NELDIFVKFWILVYEEYLNYSTLILHYENPKAIKTKTDAKLDLHALPDPSTSNADIGPWEFAKLIFSSKLY
ncbi:hypothetical protein K501DRAFT_173115, partial [Backusella circina FSU 941]